MIKINTIEKDAIRDILSTFETVTEQDLLTFVNLINTTRFTDEQLIAQYKGSKAQKKTRKYLGLNLIRNTPQFDFDYFSACAFSTYVALFSENEHEINNFKEIKISKGKYPFNFIATIEDNTYMILTLGKDGARRLNHYNLSNLSEKTGEHDITVLVIPPGYEKNLDLDDLYVAGTHRIALLTRDTNSSIKCNLLF